MSFLLIQTSLPEGQNQNNLQCQTLHYIKQVRDSKIPSVSSSGAPTVLIPQVNRKTSVRQRFYMVGLFSKSNSTWNRKAKLFWNVYRMTKKTYQLVIFERNNTAKFTKICIYPNLRTASPNLKSDSNCSYTKCPKISI